MYKIYNTKLDKFYSRGKGWKTIGRVWGRSSDLKCSLSYGTHRQLTSSTGEWLHGIEVWHYAKDGTLTKKSLGLFIAEKVKRHKERKPFQVPFVNNSMRVYPYVGKHETAEYIDGSSTFDAHLVFRETMQRRSGTGARFFDKKTGREYAILPAAFDVVIPQLIRGEISGTWRFVNRSGCYGIEIVKAGERIVSNAGHSWL